MNKKLIRLTESDLHKIVKESVRRILAEAEIDPRSWDAVARRYDQTDPQKAAYARQRAAQKWNNQYGIDDYSDVDANGTNVHSTTKSNMNVGDDGNYLINQSVNDIRTKRNGKISNNSSTVDYNPKTQIGSYTEKGSNGMHFNPNGNGAYQNTQQGDIYMYGNKMNSSMGKTVAQQMAQGNGVYDKTRGGWQ
jgi:hypothetical protein